MKKWYQTYLRPVYLSRSTYFLLGATAFLMVAGFLFPVLIQFGAFILALLGVLVIVDYVLLFRKKDPVAVHRFLPERFSNGDLNPVRWELINGFGFMLHVRFLEEWPAELTALRKWKSIEIRPSDQKEWEEKVRPVERGRYLFHKMVLLVKSPLGLVVRRLEKGEEQEVKVYPSYLEIRKHGLLALADARSETGSRSLRRIGHSMEFEQIREYVTGDDVRAINWKASARRGQHMVNHYTEERAQQVYCLIDKSRVMKMSFHGLSLLDYAINASLMLLRVALTRQDKAGLISFSEKTDTILPAEKRGRQMNLILETLYKESTAFSEADYEKLYVAVKKSIPQRSLLVLFTNFESRAQMERQLPYLQMLNARHLLLVVFFENTELNRLAEPEPESVEDVYRQTIARQFMLEKRTMVKALQQKGILSILCAPEAVTVQTINKYVELKSRMLI